MSTGISGSKTVFSMVMIASSLTLGVADGVSPSGVQAPWMAGVVVASSLTARLLGLAGRAVERRVQGVPGQRRALHPAGKFMHARKRLQPLHLVRQVGAAIRAGAGHRQGAELVGEGM